MELALLTSLSRMASPRFPSCSFRPYLQYFVCCPVKYVTQSIMARRAISFVYSSLSEYNFTAASLFQEGRQILYYTHVKKKHNRKRNVRNISFPRGTKMIQSERCAFRSTPSTAFYWQDRSWPGTAGGSWLSPEFRLCSRAAVVPLTAIRQQKSVISK